MKKIIILTCIGFGLFVNPSQATKTTKQAKKTDEVSVSEQDQEHRECIQEADLRSNPGPEATERTPAALAEDTETSGALTEYRDQQEYCRQEINRSYTINEGSAEMNDLMNARKEDSAEMNDLMNARKERLGG